MMRPHPVVEKMLEDEIERRVSEVMDLIDDYVGVWRDHEYYSSRHGEGADEHKAKVEARIRLLVMGSMVADMSEAGWA